MSSRTESKRERKLDRARVCKDAVKQNNSNMRDSDTIEVSDDVQLWQGYLFETRRASRLAGSSLWVTERSTQRSLVRRAELRRMDAGLSTRASWASRTLTNSVRR
mmetsp:Transcript_6463/g.8520  ORF Transcript_6463/g.8520 Transcript_6463/m.8520 type:complete len:105 (+) Transcript_6463:87-401(+)